MRSALIVLAVLLVGLVVAWIRRVVRLQRIISKQLQSYRRADYEEQLRIVEGLRSKDSGPAEYEFFRAVALFELGDLRRAEECLRKALALEQNRAITALNEDELGLVLLEQRRYDEAIACFERSVANAPARGGAHRGIAAALLRQGRQIPDALRRAGTAVELDEAARKFPREDLNLNLAESLAILAWAAAAYAGDGERVESLLDRSFELCPETTKPIRTEIHYHAGMAYRALDRPDDSLGQFTRAVEIDPQGNFGRLSATEAHTISRTA